MVSLVLAKIKIFSKTGHMDSFQMLKKLLEVKET